LDYIKKGVSRRSHIRACNTLSLAVCGKGRAVKCRMIQKNSNNFLTAGSVAIKKLYNAGSEWQDMDIIYGKTCQEG
jgi:hypothetical protein